jgi:hypothetical protein
MLRSFVRITILAAHGKRSFRDFNHLSPVIADDCFVHGEIAGGGHHDGFFLGDNRSGQLLQLLGLVGFVHQSHNHENERCKHKHDRPDQDTSIFHNPLLSIPTP